MGFLAKGEARPTLDGIYDLALLDQVLSEKGLPTIEAAATTTGGNNTPPTTSTTDAPLPDVVS